MHLDATSIAQPAKRKRPMRRRGGAVRKPIKQPNRIASKPLTPAEEARLAELESTIQHAQKLVIEIGACLKEIEASALYREAYESFDQYCRARFGWSKDFVKRVTGAAAGAKFLLDLAAKSKGIITNFLRKEDVVTLELERKPTAKAGKFYDAIGREVPEAVVPLWSVAANAAKQAIANIKQVRKAIADDVASGDKTGKVFAELDNGDVAACDEILKSLTERVTPFVICPTCNGMEHQLRQCSFCYGRGYISRARWFCLPAAERELIIASAQRQTKTP